MYISNEAQRVVYEERMNALRETAERRRMVRSAREQTDTGTGFRQRISPLTGLVNAVLSLAAHP